MDAGKQKMISDIEQFGCHVIHVLEEGDLPPFSYSVGIERTIAAPELVIVGLKRSLSHDLVNSYNHRIRGGDRFEAGQRVAGFLSGFDCELRSVHPSHYEEYFGQSLWFYSGPEFRVLQLVYPTVDGVWPWEPEATTWFRDNQPLLDTPRSG